jgi:hypothetical protein
MKILSTKIYIDYYIIYTTEKFYKLHFDKIRKDFMTVL